MRALLRFTAIALVLAGLAPAPVLAFGGGGSSSGGGGSSSSSGSGGSGKSSGNHDPSQSASALEFARAVQKVDAEKYADAIPLLEKVVEADPKNANAFNYLGYSYRRLGQIDKALVYYGKALALNPKHRGANEYLGELYLEMKQVDKAKERLDVLGSVCTGCEEYVELKKKIDAYTTGS